MVASSRRVPPQRKGWNGRTQAFSRRRRKGKQIPGQPPDPRISHDVDGRKRGLFRVSGHGSPWSTKSWRAVLAPAVRRVGAGARSPARWCPAPAVRPPLLEGATPASRPSRDTCILQTSRRAGSSKRISGKRTLDRSGPRTRTTVNRGSPHVRSKKEPHGIQRVHLRQDHPQKKVALVRGVYPEDRPLPHSTNRLVLLCTSAVAAEACGLRRLDLRRITCG